MLARQIPHPGGERSDSRVRRATEIAYLSDHGPTALGAGPDGWGPYHEAATTLVEGVDLLLHDAQFMAAELASRARFGHSAVGYAVGLAEPRRASAGCSCSTTTRAAPTTRSKRSWRRAPAPRSMSLPPARATPSDGDVDVGRLLADLYDRAMDPDLVDTPVTS